MFEHILILPIFCAGLLLNKDRLNAKRHTEGVISNPKLKWNMITPNDLLENCFDGYSLVRIYGLQQINVKFNEICWLDLGPRELKYLSLAGQRYFPFFIQPSRIDRITFTVKWETSDMLDVTDEVDTNSADKQKIMKYFFNNQNTCSLLAAYDYWTEGNHFTKSIPIMLVIYDQVKTWLKTLKQAVVVIQRWWINIYYNPCHPVGNRIVKQRMLDRLECIDHDACDHLREIKISLK